MISFLNVVRAPHRCTLARQHFTAQRPCIAIPSLSDTPENNAEWAALLFALGNLWQNGVTIDWDAFYAYEERCRIPLPMYPFERQRYWIDPAFGSLAASAGAQTSGGLSSAVSVSAAPLLAMGGAGLSAASAAMLASASVDQEPAASINSFDAQQAASNESRSSRLAARLLEIIAPVSGRDPSQIGASATLLEQGFDSLSLTQVAFAIRKEFGVRLTFSQLMKEFPSLEMIAAHLDSVLAPDVFAAIVQSRPEAKPRAEAADPFNWRFASEID